MKEEQCLRLRLRPLTAFGSSPKGDTWFGQMCWTLRHRFGESYLTELLEGYTSDRPFAVMSDAFPAEHLPRPALPVTCFQLPADMDHKQFKRCKWLPFAALQHPLDQWLVQAVEAAGNVLDGHIYQQPHNSINRRTGTTGSGFAPYSMRQIWYGKETRLDVYVALDTDRLTADELASSFEMIGQFGFGRDASIGLGKFSLEHCEPVIWPQVSNVNASLTLAPCAPQGLPLEPQRSFYQVFTRFGRHGDQAVHQGNPFKAPVLLADTAAVLGMAPNRGFIGRGLGGQGLLSKALPATVQQGYAPVIPIRLPEGGSA